MMELPRFDDLSAEEQGWLDAYVDGTIDAGDFESLQDRLMEKPELRVVLRRYLSIDHSLQLMSGDAGAESAVAIKSWNPIVRGSGSGASRFPSVLSLAAAAALAFLLGTGFMYLISKPSDDLMAEVFESGEKSARGFAVIGGLFDATWPDAEQGHREGDLLGAEVFRLASGMAEIQFFSGANMMVEGPAEIVLTSAWEASCRDGAVRMQVPPAARGFRLQAPSSEIVDLGTEFGLVVRDGMGQVEVFDGEISISHEGEAQRLVEEGGAFSLVPDGPMTSLAQGAVTFPDTRHFGSRSGDRLQADFDRWTGHRDGLVRDERLVAYYTFDQPRPATMIPNLAQPRDPEMDGAVVLAEQVAGRWKEMKPALEFRRPGSRVRVNLPGEFPALTFACWVRIDSLDRKYSALFMGDGYETGEPHWQVREDGKMMLSVMVDDTGRHPKFPNRSRYHHVYYSPPIWDLSMSGEWLHLVSVFDPDSQSVSHYLDGEKISREGIQEDFQIDRLRIGNAEIGNWGQPFREDPSFAIRNLNGAMDELVIYGVALYDGEVAELFESSRSQRR